MTRPPRAAALALVIAGIVALAPACGGSDSSKGAGRSTTTSRATTSATSAESYVGLSKQAAIAKAEAEQRPWRILREDEEVFPATQDYVENRINFEIDNDTVTTATFG